VINCVHHAEAATSYGLVTEMKKGAYKKFANMGQKMEDVVGVTTYIDPVGNH
jgi:hypothetical protein